MKYTPDIHHRRSVRLGGFDYAGAGAYFVTICTKGRELWFETPEVKIIAEACWLAIPQHFPNTGLDEWIVMPNHVHGVIVLVETAGAQHVEPPHNRYQHLIPKSIGSIMRSYKSAVTLQCRKAGHGYFQWQKNYYERVLRDEEEMNRVRQYIRDNPLNWGVDEENPQTHILRRNQTHSAHAGS